MTDEANTAGTGEGTTAEAPAAAPVPTAEPRPPLNRMWLLVGALVALVLAAGTAVFLLVREPASRPFDYGTVPFVPGESQYGVHNR
jgi:hypothetical protein